MMNSTDKGRGVYGGRPRFCFMTMASIIAAFADSDRIGGVLTRAGQRFDDPRLGQAG